MNDSHTALCCLDLTSLNDTDTDQTIRELCTRAVTPYGKVAAVCVYPEFVGVASECLNGAGVDIATVINFPFGNRVTKSDVVATIENTHEKTLWAISDGATEIDVVLDYNAFLNNDLKAFDNVLECINTAYGCGVKVKVILETAAFDDMDRLREACDELVRHNVDFLKTSTGKHARGGATPDAARVLSAAAARAGCGVKISGGVKTLADCQAYITLARDAGIAVAPDKFRFGASGVLDVLLRELGGDTPQTAHTGAPSPIPTY
jgi:deoxyribose-phosphate aldolase